MRIFLAFLAVIFTRPEDWGQAFLAVVFLLGWKAISVMEAKIVLAKGGVDAL